MGLDIKGCGAYSWLAAENGKPGVIVKFEECVANIAKYVFSWGEKHCPPPNYRGIGPRVVLSIEPYTYKFMEIWDIFPENAPIC